MKRTYLIAIMALVAMRGMCQTSVEDIKAKAKQMYLENVKSTYAKLGLPLDSATVAKGLEQIDKMYPTNSTAPATQTELKRNQCLLSDGVIYTVGYGMSKDGKKIASISIPLNGEVQGTTLYFNKNVESLPDVFRAVANKWREWDATAKEHNIASLSKELPILLPKSFASWCTTSWHFSDTKEQTLQYILTGGESSVLVIGYYTDGLNEYIHTKATYTWHSPDDLDKIADIINVGNLMKMQTDASNVNDLFK